MFEDVFDGVREEQQIAEITCIAITSKEWNEKKPAKQMLPTAYRRKLNKPVLADESGVLYDIEIGTFVGHKKMADWLRKNKGEKSIVDDLISHFDCMDNHLVTWLRGRNWKPMIRRLWINWLRKGSP